MNFQNGMTCGGAYMKLLTQSVDLDLVRIAYIPLVKDISCQ